MRVFRRCMFLEILSTLSLREGQAPPHQQMHRRMLLTLFAGRSRRRRLVQSVMDVLPNGDWTDDAKVEVWVASNADVDKSVVARITCNALGRILLGSTFTVFNRNRWTHNDDAICRLAMIEAVHRLLTRTFTLFLAHVCFFGKTNAKLFPTSHCELSSFIEEVPEALKELKRKMLSGRHDAQDQEAVAPAEGAEEDEASALQLVESSGADTTAPTTRDIEGRDFAKENRKNRWLAYKWLRAEPLRDLIAIRIRMEPSMACLGTQLFISSNKFERQQAVAIVKAAESDKPFERDFPLLFRARGDLDEQFASHQRIIFSNHFLMVNITVPNTHRCL